jgi:hypothetical protein
MSQRRVIWACLTVQALAAGMDMLSNVTDGIGPMVLAVDGVLQRKAPADSSVRLTAISANTATTAGSTAIDGVVCQIDEFQDAYNYESNNGFFKVQLACETMLRQTAMLQFNPPSAWEVFNAVCKGTCRDLYERTVRMQAAEARTNCSCAATQVRCPQLPSKVLCAGTGLCWDSEWYQVNVCAVNACGRWATNEADYRSARSSCQMSLDTSGAYSTRATAFAGAMAALAATISVASAWHSSDG